MNYITKIKELYKDKKYTSAIDVGLFIYDKSGNNSVFFL